MLRTGRFDGFLVNGVEEVIESNVNCEGDIIKLRLKLFNFFGFIGGGYL